MKQDVDDEPEADAVVNLIIFYILYFLFLYFKQKSILLNIQNIQIASTSSVPVVSNESKPTGLENDGDQANILKKEDPAEEINLDIGGVK